MVKVKILQNVGVGVAGAATLAGVGAGTVACSSPAEGTASSEAADTAISAGSGAISLLGYQLTYGSTSGGDEFIRAGETMKLNVRAYDVGYYIGLESSAAEAAALANKLKITAHVTYLNGDGSTASSIDLPITFKQLNNYVVGTTPDFTIRNGVPRLRLSFDVTDENGNQTTIDERNIDHAMFAIFGAYGQNKLALFDNDASGKHRQRIVEGGALIAGKNVTVSYTDWRADREADRINLDTTIGEGPSYSRFGTTIVPVHGDLRYEISFAYSTDDGQTWKDGGILEPHGNPDSLNIPGDTFRRAYEKTMRLPDNAKSFKVAFHLKAILAADPHGGYISHWKDGIRLGAEYVLRDVWDNNDGQNYSLSVSAP